MRITGVELNTAEDVLKLQHLLDAHLLAHHDEIEELCACAVKEEQAGTRRMLAWHGVALGWMAEHGSNSSSAQAICALQHGLVLPA